MSLGDDDAIGFEFRTAFNRCKRGPEWPGTAIQAWRDPLYRRLVLMELDHPGSNSTPTRVRIPVERPDPPPPPDTVSSPVTKPVLPPVMKLAIDRKSLAAGERPDD